MRLNDFEVKTITCCDLDILHPFNTVSIFYKAGPMIYIHVCDNLENVGALRM